MSTYDTDEEYIRGPEDVAVNTENKRSDKNKNVFPELSSIGISKKSCCEYQGIAAITSIIHKELLPIVSVDTRVQDFHKRYDMLTVYPLFNRTTPVFLWRSCGGADAPNVRRVSEWLAAHVKITEDIDVGWVDMWMLLDMHSNGSLQNLVDILDDSGMVFFNDVFLRGESPPWSGDPFVASKIQAMFRMFYARGYNFAMIGDCASGHEEPPINELAKWWGMDVAQSMLFNSVAAKL